MFGLVGSASAGLTTALTTKVPVPFAAIPVAVMVAASQVEYKACNDEPYVLVSHAKGSNYNFNVSTCEYNANPEKFKKQ